jgi:peptidoglycan/LPS O-acetylase OafA/YrhL
VLVFCLCGLKKQPALILMLECLSAAGLVALVAWQQAVPVFRFLDLGIVRFYGRISYSFYLLHPLGILFALRILGPVDFRFAGWPVSVIAMLLTFASILVTTPAAYLSWRLIEMPFINLVKNAKRPHRADLPAVS